MHDDVLVRRECLTCADGWVPPTGLEVRLVLKLAGLSGSQASGFLGLGSAGARTIRKWAAGEGGAQIPYSAWALLCYKAGLGVIFE